MAYDKIESRQKRKLRIRKKISGTAERPRLSVFRSAKHIYAQLVDDALRQQAHKVGISRQSRIHPLEGVRGHRRTSEVVQAFEHRHVLPGLR